MSKYNELDSLLAMALDGGIFTEKQIRCLIDKVKEILVEESNLVTVNAPVNICGDIRA